MELRSQRTVRREFCQTTTALVARNKIAATIQSCLAQRFWFVPISSPKGKPPSGADCRPLSETRLGSFRVARALVVIKHLSPCLGWFCGRGGPIDRCEAQSFIASVDDERGDPLIVSRRPQSFVRLGQVWKRNVALADRLRIGGDHAGRSSDVHYGKEGQGILRDLEIVSTSHPPYLNAAPVLLEVTRYFGSKATVEFIQKKSEELNASARLSPSICAYMSRFFTSSALSSMTFLRGSTASPIKTVNISSVSTASFT